MRIINTPDFIKKHKVLAVILALVITLCLWWAWAQLTPHPLGDRMEYLGKKDYGNILGFDSAPYSEYYYGTNIPPEEVAKYFNRCELKEIGQLSNEYASVWLTCSGNTALITYYNTSQASFKTNEKYLVSILDEHYNILKKSF